MSASAIVVAVGTRELAHVENVLRVVERGRALRPHDPIIERSWKRCVVDHQLDPTRAREAIIVPETRIREHQGEMGELLTIARQGIRALYEQVAGMGYAVLLTDEHGVTVDFLGDLQLEGRLRRAGLYLGADWSETSAGTCGVGTCIATGESLTVHQDDHFDPTHIPLTCTTAPVFDSAGKLRAVIDVSALSSPESKASQYGALHLVKSCATALENAAFFERHRTAWIIRLGSSPHFLEVRPEHLFALDERGLVVGHNRSAQLLFEADRRGPLLGRTFASLVEASLDDLGLFSSDRTHDVRTKSRPARRFFIRATPPPTPRASVHLVPETLPLVDPQLTRASRVLASGVTVLVTGETGTGKEYFARGLHERAGRQKNRFVAVSCAAIPETLIESELFGHVPGSFSGASPRGKRGLLQVADHGTLFLDEIAELSPAMQAALLRALSEREVMPIGATRAIPVDLHVVAATHRDLEALVKAGRFRDDLYYRVASAVFTLKPLRERTDFDAVLTHLLRATSTRHTVSREAHAVLAAHRWPGNLRELSNVLAYACSVANDARITIADLPDSLRPLANDEAVALTERLRASGWNVAAVARDLGIARMTLYRRMKRHNITSPNALDQLSHPRV